MKDASLLKAEEELCEKSFAKSLAMSLWEFPITDS